MRSLLPALARLALLASFALLLAAPALAQQSAAPPGSPAATAAISGTQLPAPDPKFGGVIKEDALQSKPWWPPRIVPPKGAPNVLLIITDDAGFGVPSTFGGVIPTPTMERIAQQGLRYNRVFSTALCSPTRAALITGRNHHSAGFGVISEQSTGFPGYNSIIPKDKATIGRILLENGYSTSWFGKDHNTPAFAASQVGPPLGRRPSPGEFVTLGVTGRLPQSARFFFLGVASIRSYRRPSAASSSSATACSIAPRIRMWISSPSVVSPPSTARTFLVRLPMAHSSHRPDRR